VFVTDTHALVHYVEQRLSRIGKDARRIFNQAEENKTLIYIPSPVLWEISRHLADGVFAFPMPFDRWCRHIEEHTGFSITPLDWPDINEARYLPFQDPFDCLIAGTAVRLGMPLITKDAEIRESALVETIW
jgi:PIN domain nuclease of toxin-antitoxin system